ncbi:brefeldin A-inhibited guanine nucleotide-exchange protein 5 [Dorcoceras hygrometricum]|uniref:Brefeldin A-inhibited guanine nucleotide-exchange protein 5 n=1 Tax=Dorcoceras hygrometricum TaxID=472368 RepID=A0A2Z7CDY0_9LAMI|nr:brefeldin A-inhibited guanine nucleotide-exchange protein 5 [Dorcoceras hygrometricum]
MAPSAPRTRAAVALRMKQIALDNQSRTIRRLRVQLATERRGLATIKKEHESTQVALEASHKTIAGLTEIGLTAEDSLQAQHRIIEALVEEKDSLLQTIQGLQEANGAPAPFDDGWEEEPEEDPGEEEIEEIPMGEGEIDDE